MGTHSLIRLTMRNIIILSIFGLCAFEPMVEAVFFGPVAVGIGLGVLAVGKGLLIGALLSRGQSRHRRHHGYGSTRRYRYNSNNHYSTSHNTKYYQPNKYYYSSNSYSNHHSYGRKRYGRSAEDEIDANSVNITEWYEDMSIKDQDDCGKRMFCELRAKEASGVTLVEDEMYITQRFGEGNAVDVSKVEVEFDVAGHIGKNMGIARCAEIYGRCDTEVDVIMAMIRKEFAELQKMDMTKAEMNELLEQEDEDGKREMTEAIEQELNEKNIDPATIW